METKEKNLEQDIESWLLNEGGYVKGNMWTYVPFNQGSNGAGNIGDGGNPANPDGYPTSYLWEKVLRRDMLLALLQRYISLQVEKKVKLTKLQISANSC